MKKKRFMQLVLFLCLLLCLTGTASAATYRNTLRTVNGKIYYYNAKGKKVKKTWKTIRSKRYYFRSNGAAAVGPTTIGNAKYLFSSKGVLQKNGYKTYKGVRYYVNSKGKITAPPEKPSDSDATSNSLAPLKSKLKKAIKSYRGTWSVYVKNLDTNEEISINNRSMYAASLIKLYAAGTAYDRIEKKKLSEAAVKSTLNSMITVSDNWCFNDIVRRVGKTTINRWCKKNGYTQTNQAHGLSGTGNDGGLYNGTGSNRTSVKDCGRFLEAVYRGTCVSKTSSNKILKLLKRQTRRSKIPAGVPSKVTVANKTGETNDYCHDAAIVYSKGATYIICVMSHVPGGAWGANPNVKKLSQITYKYFN